MAMLFTSPTESHHTLFRLILLPLLLFYYAGVLPAQTPFEEALEQNGIPSSPLHDWSDSPSIKIPEPGLAYMNITGVQEMPQLKSIMQSAMMEFYDDKGNGFRKPVLLNAQGNSSMALVKKSFKAQFIDAEGNETTIAVGDWVEQDAFHLKAYYEDFFRGVGVVGYQLFHQMQADCGAMWERATLESPHKKARCYPDGFPCLVYLNGEFNGIYVWQLKKNRKNMNQKKELAVHIHLDGIFGNSSFWNDKVDWKLFEVRNPKNLYTMNGKEYDGNNPLELMDETSPYYDLPDDSPEVKADKQRTAQVKQHILRFCSFRSRLEQLTRSGADDSAMRAEMRQYFDIPSLVDYVCFSYYVNNYDGFWKNWQWFTYDGTKWFVAPYDLDCTFGNHSTANFLLPVGWNYEYCDYTSFPPNAPLTYLRRYFLPEMKARYAELRNKNILSPSYVKGLLSKWYHRIGVLNYAKEWTQWPDSPCIGETICNAPWETQDDWTGYGLLAEYDGEKDYKTGEKCVSGKRIWKATLGVKGIPPYAQLGYTDNLQRVCQWVDSRTKLIDQFFAYQPACSQEVQELLPVGLPVVEIETVDGEEPTAEPIDPPAGSIGGSITNATKVPGRVRLWLPDGSLAYDSGDYAEDESGMTIKIRGNWSGRSPKPPFKIKLQTKADLLLRGDDEQYEDKEWLLMRDMYMNLNQKIGLRVSELIGMQWTPAAKYVNVVFNGDFRGLYLLTEAVKRNPRCRLNVDKKTGYIIEYDAYWWNEEVAFKGTMSDTRFRYTLKYPEEDDISVAQLDYIRNATLEMERSISAGTYPEHIDVKSFVKWMLAHDILGNADGGGSNIFLTKYNQTDDSKFTMGNLWDFDRIMATPSMWAEVRCSNEFFFQHLFNSPNQTFANAYAQEWRERGAAIVSTLIDELQEFAASEEAVSLNKARRLDAERWRLTPYVSVEEDVTTAVRWFSQRAIWLNAEINTKVDEIPVESGDDAEAVYDLQGRPMPQARGHSDIVIRRGKKYLAR